MTLTFGLLTITPQVGGAAVSRQSNRRVRPSGVANGLRRWWRALYGHQFSSTGELFAVEAVLWGSTEHPGRCKVDVTIDQLGTTERIEASTRYNGYPAYVLFPFAENGGSVAKGVRFTLRVTVPADREQEVRRAVAAFVNYGGVGSRSRRGCGSLACTTETLAPPMGSDERPAGSLLTLVPATFYAGAVMPDPVAAWNAAVNVYQDFRQGVGFARDVGTRPIREGSPIMRPGQSRYPEADSLRALTHRFGHPDRRNVRGYPRADLGLPIGFEFKDPGEPPRLNVQGSPSGRQRFGSPVITKALAVEGGYRPMLMVLNSPHVWEGTDVEIEGRGPLTRSDIDLPATALQQIPPLNGLPIRKALVQHALNKGFTPFQPGGTP